MMEALSPCFQGKRDSNVGDLGSHALHARARKWFFPKVPLHGIYHPPICFGGCCCCAAAVYKHEVGSHSRRLPRTVIPLIQRPTPASNGSPPPATKKPCSGRSFWRRSHLQGIVFSVLSVICIIPYVCCIRQDTGSQMEIGVRAQVELAPSDSEKEMDGKLSRLIQHQVAQMKYQKMLEATAVPYLKFDLRSSPAMRGAMDVASGAESQLGPPSMVDLGSFLAGAAGDANSPESGLDLRFPEVQQNSGAPAQASFSFINWGQVGAMMQSPALAHTGMPVYMPRQAVGTTIGLDFDSPATFHGPLLVALMVSILVFFVVLMLCCWMVKSKQKHDKFMAEKIPR